jgi:hypothetical protein
MLSRQAVSAVLLPTSVTGCQLWIEAAKEAYANNDPCGTLTDWSGNSRNMTALTTARPLFKTNVQNGLPSFLFDGSDDNAKTAGFTLNQPCTYVFAMRQVTWTDGRRVWDGDTVDTAVLYQVSSTPQVNMYAGTNLSLGTGFVLNTFYLWTAIYNGASSLGRRNGSQVATGAAGAGNPGGLRLGSTAIPNNFGNIEVLGGAIYNSELSGANLTNAEKYWKDKFALY